MSCADMPSDDLEEQDDLLEDPWDMLSILFGTINAPASVPSDFFLNLGDLCRDLMLESKGIISGQPNVLTFVIEILYICLNYLL